jgi:putative SOS response-associated peptidase YedK
MCGRFASTLPLEQIARMFGIRGALPNLAPNWNVAPTQRAAVVRRHPETGERSLDLLTWGLVPHFTKDLKACKRPINARAETVATSGMFRGALASRRCLVPADAFYEWRPWRTASSLMRSPGQMASRWPSLACGKAGAARMGRRCARSPSSPPRPTRR